MSNNAQSYDQIHHSVYPTQKSEVENIYIYIYNRNLKGIVKNEFSEYELL